MSSAPTTLMGVGVPDKVAVKLGNTIRTIAGVGTSQALGALITVNSALLTTAGGATAFTLPTTWEVGEDVSVFNTSATAALLYPQVGGAFNGGSTDASISIAQNVGVLIRRMSTTSWRAIASNAGTGTAFTDITADSITGSDASLGIAGLAAAQGGAVAVVGGASSTSGNAGGAVTATGGAGGATGAGGAVTLAGAAGGATSGSGGAATLTGGAGTNGNATGGVATVTAGAAQGTGSGAAASLIGGASGAGATGNGGNAVATGGAALSTNGNGGNIVLTGGALAGSGKAGAVYHRGTSLKTQGAPAAKTVTAAITAAELVAGLITTTGATGPSIHQLPTGTLIDAELPGIATGDSFDFSIINTGVGASDDATITVNTDVTIVGNPTVGALTDATIIVGSGLFRARRSGANTYVVYRIG